ncbi:MAG TPA: fluoride efflux transporter CrcB [Chloroflexaceae bacterium]|nr:fluoride efflux transporter CrcB [Chloroflexaceae bacterium]
MHQGEPPADRSAPQDPPAPTVVEQAVSEADAQHLRPPPALAWPPPILPRHELAIALGAMLGAGSRYGLGLLVAPSLPAGLPLGTLAANLVGCLLIGVMQTLFLDLIRAPREAQLFVSVGFLGGLTTFSSVSLETVRLLQAGASGGAAVYQALSLMGGAAAALVGIGATRLGHGVLARARRR